MEIGYIQFDVQHEREQNYAVVEKHLGELDCDLVILPELSTCGYVFPNRETLLESAETVPEGESTQRMLALSRKHHCAILFGLAEVEEGRVYNTAVLVQDGRYVGKYRKVHLSDFEKTLFTPGDSNGVFTLGEHKIGVQICFDLWFPEISREQIRQGAELLCVLGNFGGDTTFHITRIRAIENLTPLVLCNRVGREVTPQIDAYFLGKSTLVDRDGTRLMTAQADAARAEKHDIRLGARRGNVICQDLDAEIRRHPLELLNN